MNRPPDRRPPGFIFALAFVFPPALLTALAGAAIFWGMQ